MRNEGASINAVTRKADADAAKMVKGVVRRFDEESGCHIVYSVFGDGTEVPVAVVPARVCGVFYIGDASKAVKDEAENAVFDINRKRASSSGANFFSVRELDRESMKNVQDKFAVCIKKATAIKNIAYALYKNNLVSKRGTILRISDIDEKRLFSDYSSYIDLDSGDTIAIGKPKKMTVEVVVPVEHHEERGDELVRMADNVRSAGAQYPVTDMDHVNNVMSIKHGFSERISNGSIESAEDGFKHMLVDVIENDTLKYNFVTRTKECKRDDVMFVAKCRWNGFFRNPGDEAFARVVGISVSEYDRCVYKEPDVDDAHIIVVDANAPKKRYVVDNGEGQNACIITSRTKHKDIIRLCYCKGVILHPESVGNASVKPVTDSESLNMNVRFVDIDKVGFLHGDKLSKLAQRVIGSCTNLREKK